MTTIKVQLRYGTTFRDNYKTVYSRCMYLFWSIFLLLSWNRLDIFHSTENANFVVIFLFAVTFGFTCLHRVHWIRSKIRFDPFKSIQNFLVLWLGKLLMFEELIWNGIGKLQIMGGTKLFKPEIICNFSIFRATLSNCTHLSPNNLIAHSTFLGHQLYF